MLWSGADNEERARSGVGLIVEANRLIDVISEKYVNDRILKMEK